MVISNINRHIEFEDVLARAARRDLRLFGSAADVERIYRKRYIPGQRLYLETQAPRQRATLISDNTNFSNPFLITDDGEIAWVTLR